MFFFALLDRFSRHILCCCCSLFFKYTWLSMIPMNMHCRHAFQWSDWIKCFFEKWFLLPMKIEYFRLRIIKSILLIVPLGIISLLYRRSHANPYLPFEYNHLDMSIHREFFLCFSRYSRRHSWRDYCRHSVRTFSVAMDKSMKIPHHSTNEIPTKILMRKSFVWWVHLPACTAYPAIVYFLVVVNHEDALLDEMDYLRKRSRSFQQAEITNPTPKFMCHYVRIKVRRWSIIEIETGIGKKCFFTNMRRKWMIGGKFQWDLMRNDIRLNRWRNSKRNHSTKISHIQHTMVLQFIIDSNIAQCNICISIILWNRFTARKRDRNNFEQVRIRLRIEKCSWCMIRTWFTTRSFSCFSCSPIDTWFNEIISLRRSFRIE